MDIWQIITWLPRLALTIITLPLRLLGIEIPWTYDLG